MSNSMPSFRRFAPLVFSAVLLSSCTFLHDRLGSERTVPDGGQNELGDKHTPVLNPGGALFNKDQSLKEMSAHADNPYLTENQSLTGSLGADRKVPSGNQMAINSSQSAPVQPVAAAPLAPNYYNPNAAPSSKGFPSLATVPPSPTRPSSASMQHNVQQMQYDHALADAASNRVNANPEVSSMQNDARGIATAPQASVTPSRTVTATTAAPQDTSDTGFSKWLHETLADNNTTSPKPAAAVSAQASPVNLTPTAWKNPNLTPAQPAPAIAAAPARSYASASPHALEPIHLTRPANLDGEQDQANLPAPVAPLAPIHLTPPPQVQGASPSVSPDQIALTLPPEMDDASDSNHYLADNRYAAKRMRATQ